MTDSAQGAVATTDPGYAVYWKAWGALLLITLAMLFIKTPIILMAGIAAKATIICLWFMHLKHERLDFVVNVFIFIFATSLILYGLIVTDGRLM